MTTDLFLKDEGDFMTICFQTPKAIEVLNGQSKNVRNAVYTGGDSYKKLDADIANKDKLIAFAASHSLTIDSDF